jgi:hypothetical protein
VVAWTLEGEEVKAALEATTGWSFMVEELPASRRRDARGIEATGVHGPVATDTIVSQR